MYKNVTGNYSMHQLRKTSHVQNVRAGSRTMSMNQNISQLGMLVYDLINMSCLAVTNLTPTNWRYALQMDETSVGSSINALARASHWQDCLMVLTMSSELVNSISFNAAIGIFQNVFSTLSVFCGPIWFR